MQLHCSISDGPYHMLRMLSAQDRTTMTAPVTESLGSYA